MTDRKAFEAYVEFCNKVWQNKAIKADWGLNDVWQAATLAERERCANVCEDLSRTFCVDPQECAAAIRNPQSARERRHDL